MSHAMGLKDLVTHRYTYGLWISGYLSTAKKFHKAVEVGGMNGQTIRGKLQHLCCPGPCIHIISILLTNLLIRRVFVLAREAETTCTCGIAVTSTLHFNLEAKTKVMWCANDPIVVSIHPFQMLASDGKCCRMPEAMAKGWSTLVMATMHTIFKNYDSLSQLIKVFWSFISAGHVSQWIGNIPKVQWKCIKGWSSYCVTELSGGTSKSYHFLVVNCYELSL